MFSHGCERCAEQVSHSRYMIYLDNVFVSDTFSYLTNWFCAVELGPF